MFNDERPIIVYADDSVIAENNRVRVQGRSNMTLLPDFFLLDIYNLSNEDYFLLKNSKRVAVHTNMATLICGGVVEGIYVHDEGSNVITTVSLSDGMEFWSSCVSVSIGGGAWYRDAIKSVVNGTELGAFLCKDIRMPRGQTFTGRVANIVNSIAKSVHARAFITHDVLNIVDGSLIENVMEIYNDDVINYPSTVDGAVILKMRVKGYSVGDVVKYDGTQYRIIVQAFSLDNYEGDWNVQITLVPEELFADDGMEGGW